MKKISQLLVFTALTLLVSCSSTSTNVDQMAHNYEPVLKEEDQVERLNTMIRNSSKLDDEKKKQLISLVNQQAKKSQELRKEQSQLRAVLVDQLLVSSDGSNSKTLETSRKLDDLHKKNIKGLSDFIIQFRSISGEQAIKQNEFRDAGLGHIF